MFIPRLKVSVVDWHRFDSDPDPDFQVDADPDPDGHQNDADPYADPSKLYTCWKIRKKCLTLIHSFASLKCFYLSHQCQRYHNFHYFDRKKVKFINISIALN
jgi:hypothetical protein